MSDLISKKTRTELREYFVGTTLREISEEFDAADVPVDSNYTPPVPGQRRSLVEQYYYVIDFTSWRDVQKILRVFENVLLALDEKIKHPMSGTRDEYAERKLSILVRCLERDGFIWENGKISTVAHNPTIDELTEVAGAFDSRILRQQIDRIRNAIEDDPDLAIGTSKELLETACKTILADYGVTADVNWDLTRLVKEVRVVLELVPEDVPDSAKGSETIKRILGSLAQIPQGIAELRNLYGTGHGKDGAFKGLATRHARLAAGCATTLASFLFETHESRKEKAI
ncbi:MAG: abortive infection family protein [Candidatus Omnitrophota bacterium]